MQEAGRFDVAIVGASIAGCTAARFFALAGARVALIEQRPDQAAYKVACTHQMLPSAQATIERLGLGVLLEARGMPRTDAEFWTPYGGWVRFPDDSLHGYGVTRRTLDPLLRELAAETPGVELMAGQAVVDLLDDHDRPAGVRTRDRQGKSGDVKARLVVGADGRGSGVARMAGVRGRVRPHNRFFYFAYWRGVQPRRAFARLWLLDPDGAAQFANEDDLTVLVVAPHRQRLPEFRKETEAAYARALDRLPDGPDLSEAERVSKLIGKLDVPNVIRPAAAGGMAFVGDAALAADPLFGVGCGFAFQSAEWLADETSSVLLNGGSLDRALARYRRKFLWSLGPHHLQIADYATGRKTRLTERATFRAAAADPEVARTIGYLIAREGSPLKALDLRINARVLVHNLRHRHNSHAPLSVAEA
jgi:2-polyprenyl-6-methoxyphenol hydroxylase-like FAD-dependent oxidoreductase